MALTIDGSDPSGDLGDLLDAKLAVAGGKILQIVRATDSTERSTTSETPVDVTGMSVTITPQKSTSAILIIANFSGLITGPTGNTSMYTSITDSSNNPISGGEAARLQVGNAVNTVASILTRVGYVTPATISPVTYKLRFYSGSGASYTVFIKNNESTGQMYAIEVSA